MGVGGLNECRFYGVEETFFFENVFFGRLLEGENGSRDSSVLTTLVGCCRERGGEGVFFLISARRLNLFP